MTDCQCLPLIVACKSATSLTSSARGPSVNSHSFPIRIAQFVIDLIVRSVFFKTIAGSTLACLLLQRPTLYPHLTLNPNTDRFFLGFASIQLHSIPPPLATTCLARTPYLEQELLRIPVPSPHPNPSMEMTTQAQVRNGSRKTRRRPTLHRNPCATRRLFRSVGG